MKITVDYKILNGVPLVATKASGAKMLTEQTTPPETPVDFPSQHFEFFVADQSEAAHTILKLLGLDRDKAT